MEIETTTNESTSAETSAASEIETLIAAAKAATPATPTATDEGEGEGEAPAEGVAPSSEASGEGEGEGEAPTTPPAEGKLPRLAQIFKEREARHADRAKERSEAERVRAEAAAARAEVERLRQEAEAARREAEAFASFRKKLSTDPIAALREINVSGDKFLPALVQHAGPEGALHREIAELKSALAELRSEQGTKLKAIEEEKERERAQIETWQKEQGTRTLLSRVTPEKTPFTRAIYGSDDAIRERAQAIADRYCEETGEKICPFDDLIEYMEAEAKERAAQLAPLLAKLLPTNAGAADVAPQNERAKVGQRTLSASLASERRATPKPLEEMSDLEEREYLKNVVRGALSPTPKGKTAK